MKMKKLNLMVICKKCKKEFSPTNNLQIYCGSRCRSNHWKELYPEKWKAYQRKYYKNPLLCLQCKAVIPQNKRKNGVRFCSTKCRKFRSAKMTWERRRKISVLFGKEVHRMYYV